MLPRNTYLEIDLSNVKNNVRNIIRQYDDYQYYFGVVKADCYGQSGIKPIRAIIEGGCNYLAVATLDEALDIRKKLSDIPILCLGVISSQYIETCIQNNITVTIHSLTYLKEILEQDCSQLKVHLKLNTGMNRLGIAENEEVFQAVQFIKRYHIILEGIYTHIYQASVKEKYIEQVNKFKQLVQGVDLKQIPIVHISASEALTDYEKPDFVNRL